MNCIVVGSGSSVGKLSMLRSVEVLSYDKENAQVRILLTLQIERSSDADTYIDILHRGRARLFPCRAWPLPKHPDEPDDGLETEGVLESVYRDCFDLSDTGGKKAVISGRQLSAWDSWYDEKVLQTVHMQEAPDIAQAYSTDNELMPLFEHTRESGVYVPFTVWRLGGLEEPGRHLLTFVLQIDGETYNCLVGSQQVFTVDGPERLISAIKYSDLPGFPRDEQEEYHHRLELFDPSYLKARDGYDVIVLPRRTDTGYQPVNVLSVSGANHAPIQPSFGNRFVTSHSRFTISLSYNQSNSLILEQILEMLTHDSTTLDT